MEDKLILKNHLKEASAEHKLSQTQLAGLAVCCLLFSACSGPGLKDGFGGEPERGDIVIFKHKSEPGRSKTRLVKRIIGLPGETVDIRDNRIYIDNSETPLEEPYLPEPMESDDYHFEVPKGCYLMLGDNRNHSADARRWSDPYVPKEEILAKVMFRYFPGIKKIQ